MSFPSRLILTLLLGIFLSIPVRAEELLIAVASNFTEVLRTVVEHFEQATGHTVTLTAGATGRHHAQIMNGAPYDVFLAANSESPRLLEESGKAITGSRHTYARGRLVLWSPEANLIDAEADILASGDYRFLAIANPRLAPYGLAAEQVLRLRGLWDELNSAGRIVRGENIAQTFQFVESGNAQLGLVALSQIKSPAGMQAGSWWEVPADMHEPIDQQLVLLREKPVAREFLTFLRSEQMRELISSFGYGVD